VDPLRLGPQAHLRHRNIWFRPAWGWIAAALFVLGVLLKGSVQDDAPETIAAALADLTTVAEIPSSDASRVENWLEAQMGYAVRVPRILDAALEGGRVVTANGTEVAAVNYRLRGQPLTYLAMTTARVMGRRIEEDRIETMSLEGFSLAAWTEQGSARILMAPIPEQEVVAVARECKREAEAL
jgi:anti-sigma factor RsiW